MNDNPRSTTDWVIDHMNAELESRHTQRTIICNRIDALRKEIDAAEGRRALAAKKLREARALAEDYTCHYLEYCQALDGLNEELQELIIELSKIVEDEQ